jgi:hypothetical protein
MIVLTTLTKYSVGTITPFVKSLKRTEFTGRKIVLYYEPDIKVVEYLESNDWEVYTYDKPQYFITLQRFIDASTIIQKLKLENETLCFTDIKDVFFAKSPSDIKTNFYIGVDAYQTFEYNLWNRETIVKGFPDFYSDVKDKLPLCAGVIIGNGKLLKRFFKDCYNLSLKSEYDNIIDWCPVDQAAVNILAYTKYNKYLQTPDQQDNLVLNMANLDKSFDLLKTQYHIYHQYERNKKHYKFVVNLNNKSYI